MARHVTRGQSPSLATARFVARNALSHTHERSGLNYRGLSIFGYSGRLNEVSVSVAVYTGSEYSSGRAAYAAVPIDPPDPPALERLSRYAISKAPPTSSAASTGVSSASNNDVDGTGRMYVL